MRIALILATAASLMVGQAGAQSISPDDTRQAYVALQQARQQLMQQAASQRTDKTAVYERMLELGMWQTVDSVLRKVKQPGVQELLLQADMHILQNDFFKAFALVGAAMKRSPSSEKAIRLRAHLDLEAWNLEAAAERCRQFLSSRQSDKMSILLGRVYLLQKKYPEALKLAEGLIAKNPSLAAAYQLKADVYFWNQQPAQAEAPLLKSLQIDPFNADARFSYGYAIWRRVDATQLNAMAAQWDLALEVNPLHFQTHWHWGNGHTNLTYADYAEANDDQVRAELKKADELFRQNNFTAAIRHTREVELRFPTSTLPLLHRASLYYANFDDKDRTRLDSAENIFRQILARKKHFGPAHNGLSAVIKSKRIPFLSLYDSVTAQLMSPKITDRASFEYVFPDVAYFPGNIGKGMVWNQLFTAVVYFPFLSKQNRQFHIPPLHIDLATSMNSSYFRTSTTFDNRQWMDIRGVGSGAAAIEYVERGAYGERNVLLHEYVHLFHGSVLTDAENRAIRALYYQAMKENRTLDYYSRNNESEYFAQTYPAYFEPMKVHPLDFKSMNTTGDLKSKDPAMYAFLDQLIKKERAYLAGNQKVMASNWSQVYLNMSNRQRTANPQKAMALLDTALQHDPSYLPAILAYAQLKSVQKQFDEAEAMLLRAQQLDGQYAPVYVARAAVVAARMEAGDMDQQTAFTEQEKWLQKAQSLETDFQEQAKINGLQRELYRSFARYNEAIRIAETYVQNGSEISTYLRDRKDDARAFAALLKALQGDAASREVLKLLVEKKPQNYELRKSYATALLKGGRYAESVKTLQEAQRILAASNNQRADFRVLMASAYLELGQPDLAGKELEKIDTQLDKLTDFDKLRLVKTLYRIGQTTIARDIFSRLSAKGLPEYLNEYQQTATVMQ